MATKTTRTRSTRSKSQVKEQLDEIRSESREDLDRVSSIGLKTENDRVRAATASLSVDNILKNITVLGPQVQKGLIELSTLLTEKVGELNDVRSAIELAKAELKEVHDIEVVATSLENLLAEYKDKESAIEESIAELNKKYADLEASLKKNYADRAAELEATRRKEQAEFDYNLQQARLREKTDYNRKQEDLARSNALQQEALERGWAERDRALNAQEKEVADLRAKVAEFPEILKKELAANSSQIHNATKKDLTNEFALKEKDHLSKIALLEAKVAQADTDKAAMARTITELQAKLETAMKQNSEIATKALESASGTLAMTKMKEVIDSNGTGSTGGKRS